MQLTRYEVEVLKFMLQDRLTQHKWDEFLSTCSISSYEFTGVGYFLEISCPKLFLEKETIHKPDILGKVDEIEVGFILFLEGNNITLECHTWGDGELPATVRDLNFQITQYNK
ncbi:hypothetical protein [Xanthocytophaga agilis]|uniref:Uncharacterized protein n=1 Tax=Xanthocytophaga agilis TaxID=3048010 RepID=A0AAE3UHF8_9BACT|nr:hypothetical protein [Xanthocytophaga agilis]MDJ1505410.1 hypothetical protein [Xanthocytophaga agilis]